MIAFDLSGFSATPPLPDEISIQTLADALTEFLVASELTSTDAVGNSMGSRLVLECVRRESVLGSAVCRKIRKP